MVNIWKRVGISMLLLLALIVVSSIVALLFSDGASGNTAVIRITGPIVSTDGGPFSGGITTSTDILEQIERAERRQGIESIILEINSPGGSAVASDEIAQAVLQAEKPVVAWIRESGASGAYWIASAADHVVANRMSVTGSIGVLGSYLGFEEFIDEWNVTYNRLVAGERKDIGSPFRELSQEERAFLEEKLGTVHGFFLEEVARNRNLTNDSIAAVQDGRFLLGVEAFDLGLVDELGGRREAVRWLENVTGEQVQTTVYERQRGFFEGLLVQDERSLEGTFVPLLR